MAQAHLARRPSAPSSADATSVEARERRADGVSADDFIPVAYITVPSGATIKGLNESIWTYFGQP